MPEAIEVSDTPSPIPGYPWLADHMGKMPEVAIMRRFGALNVQNGLFYQSQLSYLEDELRTLEKRDYDLDTIDSRREKCNSDWYYLAGKGADESKKEQLNKFLEIREILPKFSEYLLILDSEWCLLQANTSMKMSVLYSKPRSRDSQSPPVTISEKYNTLKRRKWESNSLELTTASGVPSGTPTAARQIS
jgi:hypothetical protein